MNQLAHRRLPMHQSYVSLCRRCTCLNLVQPEVHSNAVHFARCILPRSARHGPLGSALTHMIDKWAGKGSEDRTLCLWWLYQVWEIVSCLWLKLISLLVFIFYFHYENIKQKKLDNMIKGKIHINYHNLWLAHTIPHIGVTILTFHDTNAPNAYLYKGTRGFTIVRYVTVKGFQNPSHVLKKFKIIDWQI